MGEFVKVLVRVVVVRTLWRYFITGHPLVGDKRDNATFLYAATQDLRGKPVEKLTGPIWHRLARRWAVLGVPLLFLEMSLVSRVAGSVLVTDPWWVRVSWLQVAYGWWTLGSVALAGWGSVRFVRYIRTREVTGEFVVPAWEAACDAMGYRFRSADARRMVELPDDFKPPGTPAAQHGRLTAWFYRRQERRQLARDLVRAKDEAGEETTEPGGELVPVSVAAEVEPYKQPPWTRLRRRHGSHTDEELDEPVRITLIPGKCSTTAEKNRFTQKVGPVLGMPDPKAAWVMRGRSPYVELRPNHPPPPELTWAEIVKFLDGADIEHPIIGLSYGKRVEIIDFVNDSPHLLISAAAGTGKTNLIKFVLCQRMHLGAALVVLDFKLVSHRWAQNLPGCDYAWEIEKIHDLLVAIGEEVHRRKTNAIPAGADVDTPLNQFPTLDILVEEQNALSEQLRDYWSSIRQAGEPTQSPALTALRAVVYTGRELGVHVFSVAQRASANTFGANGGDARESFSTRIMADWTIQAWKMLAGGIPFIRCPKGGRGIFAVIQATGDVAVARVPKITDREARDWAMSGVPSPGQALGGGVISGESEPVTDTDPEQVKLSDAVRLLPGPPMTLPALQQAAKRTGFPPRVGTGKRGAGLYDLAALRQWRATRAGSDALAQFEAQFTGPGVIYLFYVLVDGVRRIGYIGKTRRPLELREEEHRGDKPWADLIDGDDPAVLWQSANCTDEELGEMEEHFIRTLFPLYNIEFQMGAEHAVPKWTQIEERHARDTAAGRPLWEPKDVYNERKVAVS